MAEPTLEENKTYWKWAFASICFRAINSTLKHLKKNPSPDEDFGHVIVAGIIATYAKPFTKCHGVGNLDHRIIPQEHIKTHNTIMELRHKVIAHLDALNFQADDPTFGNINRVIIIKAKTGECDFSVLLPSTNFIGNLPIQDLCSKLLLKADYHLRRFELKYTYKPELRPGKYLLNIDPNEPRAFVPQKN